MNIQLFYAWLAGFWEGEGSIYREGPKDCLRLSICQNDAGVLEYIAQYFPAKVCTNGKNTKSHRIYWYGKKAIAVLDAMLPYIKSAYRKQQIIRYCPISLESRVREVFDFGTAEKV